MPRRLTVKYSGYMLQALSDVDEEDENAAAMDGLREVVVDGDGLVTLCPDLGDYDRPALAGRAGNHGAGEAPTNMQARGTGALPYRSR